MNKFYADSMLGKLARFLRFLGYDTLYRRDESVEEMLETSNNASRLILTKSEDIIQKCQKLDISFVQILDNEINLQLKHLQDDISLEITIPPLNARCSLCNHELHETEKQKIIHLIPEGTAEHHHRFWQCSSCEKIYWIGSHWKDIKKTISKTQ